MAQLESVAAVLPSESRDDCAVMIMAGGEGRRLMPNTLDTPKPLLSVRGRAMLSYSLEPALDLTSKVAVSACYLASQIETYLVHNYPSVACRTEPGLFHTGGSLKWNMEFIDEWDVENIVVLMGDHARRASLTEIIDKHCEAENDVTVVCSPPDSRHNQIVIEKGMPVGYLDSGVEPSQDTLAATGEYVFAWNSLRAWLKEKPEEYFDIGSTLIAPMIQVDGVRVGAYNFGDWVDLGTPERMHTFELHGWDAAQTQIPALS